MDNLFAVFIDDVDGRRKMGDWRGMPRALKVARRAAGADARRTARGYVGSRGAAIVEPATHQPQET